MLSIVALHHAANHSPVAFKRKVGSCDLESASKPIEVVTILSDAGIFDGTAAVGLFHRQRIGNVASCHFLPPKIILTFLRTNWSDTTYRLH